MISLIKQACHSPGKLLKPILKMFMAIWPLRKFYIPILLLNEECFEKKKLRIYLDFENLSFNFKPIKNYFKHVYVHMTTTKIYTLFYFWMSEPTI